MAFLPSNPWIYRGTRVLQVLDYTGGQLPHNEAAIQTAWFYSKFWQNTRFHISDSANAKTKVFLRFWIRAAAKYKIYFTFKLTYWTLTAWETQTQNILQVSDKLLKCVSVKKIHSLLTVLYSLPSLATHFSVSQVQSWTWITLAFGCCLYHVIKC